MESYANTLSMQHFPYHFSLSFVLGSVEHSIAHMTLMSVIVDVKVMMLMFFLPVICVLHIIRIAIVEEQHNGWRRLAVVLLVLVVLKAILGSRFDAEHLASTFWFIVVISPMVLLPIIVIKWVVTGFTNKTS